MKRCADIERRIHPHLARFGLTKYWCLYVFRVPDVAEARADVRTPAEIDALENRWGLNQRANDPADFEAVEAALDDAEKNHGAGMSEPKAGPADRRFRSS